MKFFGALILSVTLAFSGVSGAFAAEAKPPKEYKYISQSDLVSAKEDMNETAIAVDGVFLFTGSDFCYQIKKTKINTRDYFCFALGPVSIVRFYLKKDHPQTSELLSVKRGSKIKAFGTFDSLGNDYKYIIVDRFEVEPPK